MVYATGNNGLRNRKAVKKKTISCQKLRWARYSFSTICVDSTEPTDWTQLREAKSIQPDNVALRI